MSSGFSERLLSLVLLQRFRSCLNRRATFLRRRRRVQLLQRPVCDHAAVCLRRRTRRSVVRLLVNLQTLDLYLGSNGGSFFGLVAVWNTSNLSEKT